MKTGLKILLALMVLTIGGIFYLRHQASLPWRDSDVRTACKHAQVAYPTGTIRHSKQYHGLGSQGAYIVFTDTPKGIQAWIQASPALTKARVTRFTKKHQLIAIDSDAYSRIVGTGADSKYLNHKLYFTFPSQAWFNPHTANGMKYETTSGALTSDMTIGKVYIDWDTNTVWVEGHFN